MEIFLNLADKGDLTGLWLVVRVGETILLITILFIVIKTLSDLKHHNVGPPVLTAPKAILKIRKKRLVTKFKKIKNHEQRACGNCINRRHYRIYRQYRFDS
jgi:hypothetical protein